MTGEWHFITGEYPPHAGGVGDYTALLAARLAALDDVVHVWCPAGPRVEDEGVTVHRDLGTLALRDLRRVDRLLRPRPGHRVIVQWVAQAYGWRSLNLPFCLWLWKRARRDGEWIEIMVHEPYVEFRPGSSRQTAAAAVHRLMTIVLLRAARGIWVSTPRWERAWRPYALGRRVPFRWLPVPSNVPVAADAAAVAAVRARYVERGQTLIGSFGMYGAGLLARIVPDVLQRRPDAVVVLLGRDGNELARRVAREHPAVARRLHAPGYLDLAAVSTHLAACDVMVQPYDDGVSTRRTTAMAALAHGVPVVTTASRFTEALWRESAGVVLAPAGDAPAVADATVGLVADPSRRARVAAAGDALYRARFDVRHTIEALRAGFVAPVEQPVP